MRSASSRFSSRVTSGRRRDPIRFERLVRLHEQIELTHSI
jgi:hypothetical protein